MLIALKENDSHQIFLKRGFVWSFQTYARVFAHDLRLALLFLLLTLSMYLFAGLDEFNTA